MTTGQIPRLYGATVTLRLCTMEDVPRLAEILGRPEVAVWWGAFDEDRVRREVIAPEGDEVTFVVEFVADVADQAGRQVIGLISSGRRMSRTTATPASTWHSIRTGTIGAWVPMP